MSVRVKLLERDFITGTMNVHYREFAQAEKFDIFMTESQETVHLGLYNNNEMVAFFPSGSWAGVEYIKEK
jgi:hypothetical protein